MKRDIDILNLIHRATINEAIKWTKLDPDLYQGLFGDREIRIAFQYPLLPDETTSGADIIQVTVFGLGLTFFNGTEEMDLVRRILAAGIPEWADWTKHIDEVYVQVTNALQETDLH